MSGSFRRIILFSFLFFGTLTLIASADVIRVPGIRIPAFSGKVADWHASRRFDLTGARIYAATDAQWLYLAADVDDANLLCQDDLTRDFKNGDSVRFYLDTFGDGQTGQHSTMLGDDLAVAISPSSPFGTPMLNVIHGKSPITAQLGPRNIRYRTTLRAGGYFIELALPRAGLGLKSEFGFNVAVVDIDPAMARQEIWLVSTGGRGEIPAIFLRLRLDG